MAYRDTILGISGLLSFWELEESAGATTFVDSGPGGHDATAVATPVAGEPGLLAEGGLSVLFAKADSDALNVGDFYDFASSVGASSYIDPSADGANNAWTKSTGTAGWSLLDEGTRQPTAPSTGTDRITSSTDEQLQDLVFPNTLTYASGRTYTLWVYGIGGTKRALDVQVSNDDGATWQTRQTNVIGAGAAAAWHSVNITSWVTSQTQLDQLRVRLICNSTAGGGGATAVEVDAVYVEQSGATTHTPFSVEAWVKVGTLDSVQGADIVTKLANSSLGGWRVTATSTSLVVRRHDVSGASDEISYSHGWSTGETHHVVATYDGSTIRLYVDGASAASVASTKTVPGTTANLRIGSFSGGGNGWDGNLDAVAIYDRELTSTEVADNYTAGTTAGPANITGAAALSGTGSLSGTGRSTRFAASALSGTGSATAAGQRTTFGAAALSGAGSLSASGSRVVFGSAALAGLGDIVAAGTVTKLGAAALAGNGSLTAAGLRTGIGAAALSGTGTLTADGIVTPGGGGPANVTGAASLSGLGSLAASGVRTTFGSAALAGAGTLTTTGTRTALGAAALAGAGSLTSTGVSTRKGAAVLSGTGAMTADGVITYAFVLGTVDQTDRALATVALADSAGTVALADTAGSLSLSEAATASLALDDRAGSVALSERPI